MYYNDYIPTNKAVGKEIRYEEDDDCGDRGSGHSHGWLWQPGPSRAPGLPHGDFRHPRR